MAAKVEMDLSCVQGEDWSQTWRWLDGAQQPVAVQAGAMQVRSFGGVLLASGDVTVTPATGTISVAIPATITTGLRQGSHLYDVVVTDPDGDQVPFARGLFLVERSVVVP